HLVAQLWLRDEPVSFARLASVLTETDQSCGTVARVGFADGLMMCLSGERHGSETDVLLDGSRVLAYDFAEHDPSHPHRIVGSIPDARRSLADHDALARLHQERAERVRASDGEWRIVGGEHLQIASGVAFDDVMRCRYTRALRDAVAASKPHPPCPLDVPADFARWIAASDYDGPLPLSRYLDEIRLSRPDLLDAFPEVPGRSVAGMLQWARQHGASEHAIPPFLVPEPPPDPDRPATLLPGVNLAGFLSAELGVGEVARRLATAMDAVGVPYSTYTFDRTQSRQQAQPVAADGELRYDTNVVCVNADSMGVFVQRVGPAFSAGRRRIGVWFWETSELAPMFHPAFGDVDELWAASDYVAEALRAAAPEDVSVLRFPLPIVEPVVQPGATRASLGLPTDRFVFLFSFDYLSVAQRKNPYGLVEAFRAAFAPNEGPVLVVKSINADKRPDDATRLRWVARGRDDIVLRDGYLDAPANAALLQLADCFVSLHRSEGFGFNIADAMALGTPVIATGYSGNLTFMRDDDCALVRYQEVEVGPGHFPYPARSRWAEPDLDHAATLMRAVVDDPHAARERARRARERVLREFSPTRTGEFIRDRIVALRDQTTTEPSNQPAPRPAPRRGLSRRRRP
ncbi:MAG TPA: glycosyltransferase, partial [Acidimicrobiales bacterium]